MALSCCRGSIETIWSAALKYADGLSNPSALLLAIITMILSVALLAVAMRDLPLGTAYMVWTGIGAIGSFVVGVIFFSEPMSAVRIAAALLILSGLLLMKASS